MFDLKNTTKNNTNQLKAKAKFKRQDPFLENKVNSMTRDFKKSSHFNYERFTL